LVLVEPHRALEGAPAEVESAAGSLVGPCDVDLLPVSLTDITEPQVAGLRVEAHPPRVADTDRPDLRPCAVHAGERVVGRDRVRSRIRRRRIDPQDLAEERRDVERTSLRVAARSAVAHPDVEETVGTDRDVAAVVVAVGLLDEQQLATGRLVERPVDATPYSTTWVSPFSASV
jgi:hypothetical protein